MGEVGLCGNDPKGFRVVGILSRQQTQEDEPWHKKVLEVAV